MIIAERCSNEVDHLVLGGKAHQCLLGDDILADPHRELPSITPFKLDRLAGRFGDQRRHPGGTWVVVSNDAVTNSKSHLDLLP